MSEKEEIVAVEENEAGDKKGKGKSNKSNMDTHTHRRTLGGKRET